MGNNTGTTEAPNYGAYAYTIKSNSWAFSTISTGTGALENSSGVITNTNYGLKLTPTSTVSDVTTYNVEKTDSEGMNDDKARKLADDLTPIITDTANENHSKLPTANTGTGENDERATIAILDGPGYYAVYGTASDKSDSTKELVTALALTTTNPTATVNPKVEAPSLDKKITGSNTLDNDGKAATASVGSTVNFEIDSNVPDLTGYSGYTFTISDTMSEGLSFSGTDTANAIDGLQVSIGGNNISTGYTIAHTVGEKTFSVTISYNTLKEHQTGDAASKKISVVYSAIVNDSALTTNYEKNTAKLTYSNNPKTNTTNETPEKSVYVVNVNVDVLKYTGSDSTTGTKLPDAKFKLFKGSSLPADNANSWYKYDTTTKKVTWVSRDSADEFTTGSNGQLTQQVRALEATKSTGSNYGLLETEAPKGYNKLSAPVLFNIQAAYDDTNKTVTISSEGSTVSYGNISLSNTSSSSKAVVTRSIQNNAGSVLPSTGGIGTTIFYIAGIVLVIGAAVVLVNRKHKENA